MKDRDHFEFYVIRDGVGSELTFDFSQTSDGGGTCEPEPCLALLEARCGTTCINPLLSCCKSDPSVGLPCLLGSSCAADGDLLCSCLLPSVTCGTICINPLLQCCKTNPGAGLSCLGLTSCNQDGGSCLSILG